MTVKISDLDLIAALGGTAEVEVSDSGTSWRATIAQIRSGTTKSDVGLGNVTNDAQLKIASNLSDLNNAALARQNLGLEIGTDVQAFDATLDSIADLGTAADRIAYTTGVDTWAETPLTAFARTILDDADEATFKATVNLEIGTDVQAWSARLDDVAALAVTDGNFIVGNGSAWVAESGATVRTSLGLGAGNSPQFNAVNFGHASDTTVDRASAGRIQVEGDEVATLAAENQSLSGGATVTPKNLGTQTTGTLTVDVGDRPEQYVINGGAFTLDLSAVVGSCWLQITNNGSAGTITTSAFDVVSGDSFDTTDTNVFHCLLRHSQNGDKLLHVVAGQ